MRALNRSHKVMLDGDIGASVLGHNGGWTKCYNESKHFLATIGMLHDTTGAAPLSYASPLLHPASLPPSTAIHCKQLSMAMPGQAKKVDVMQASAS